MIEGAVNPAQLDAYCRDNNFVHWFETSAKDGTNVEEAMIYLVNKILETETQGPGDYPDNGAQQGGYNNSQDGAIAVDPAADAQAEEGGGGCPC